MAPIFKLYISCWSAACIVALFLLIKGRESFALSRVEYWQFILKPWRVTTFIVASSSMIVIAPYTGDPTWDFFDAFFMSVLTYLTAPWAIGAIYNVTNRLFWNLDWVHGRGVTFAFMENNWPYSTSESAFSNIVWYTLPFMALVSFLILYFFWFKAGI